MHTNALFDFLRQVSESSRADWSRAMVYKNIDRGNDVKSHVVPVVLFLVFRKKINVIVINKSTTIFRMVYTLIDHRNDAIKCSKLCSETTRLRLVVPLEF